VGRRILFLSQRVPYPPDRGDRITTWNLVRHFLEQGHHVRIGCLCESDADDAAAAALRARGCEVMSARLRSKAWSLPWLVTRQPLTAAHFSSRRLLSELDASLRREAADLVYAYSSSTGFWMQQLASRLGTTHKVAHIAELDSDKWAQYARTQGVLGKWIYGREARLLLAAERRLARFADVSVVCSPTEAALFAQHVPGEDVVVLPNGVDLEAFRPGDAQHVEAHSVVFTGVMDYLPNVDAVAWFAEQCWPGVRARFPDAQFYVVGSAPVPRVRALHGRDGIEVTGYVPETVPWLQRAAVGVAPLHLARGIQNKVLEAMACGLPSVVSTQACQGIDAADGKHLVIADGARATRDAVIALFADTERARALGQAARQRVEEYYRWETILQGMEKWLWASNPGY
jgi:sugar transferase (PEP-CTERM/EpsH1 system associated)